MFPVKFVYAAEAASTALTLSELQAELSARNVTAARLGTLPTSGTVATAANVSAVETDTQDIQSRLPATLATGLMRAYIEDFDEVALGSDAIPANVTQINGQTVSAAAGVTFPATIGTSTLDAAGVRSALGLASGNLDTQLADLPTVAEFEARTLPAANYVEMADLPANFGDLAITVTDGHVTVGTNNDKTGYSLSVTPPTASEVATAVIDAFGVTGSVNDGSATTTSFVGDSGLSATNDFYNGAVLAFTSGTLSGIARRISDYTGSTKTFAFTEAFPSAPANADTFVILGRID